MTTTDTDELTERIAAALTEHWRAKHAATGTPCSGCTAAVLPIVAVEVRKAKAEALREAVRDMGDWADESLVVTGDEHDESTWLEWTAGEWLERRATEYEAGDSDEHR